MRLSLDWDKIPRKVARARLAIVKNFFRGFPIETFKTKHGYHIIIHDVRANSLELYLLRELFYDDPIRIKLDKLKKLSPKQVLWTKKNGYAPKPITL